MFGFCDYVMCLCYLGLCLYVRRGYVIFLYFRYSLFVSGFVFW